MKWEFCSLQGMKLRILALAISICFGAPQAWALDCDEFPETIRKLMSENEALGAKLKSIKTKEERCRFAREEAHPLFRTVISEVKLYRNCPKYAEVAERILENIEKAVSEKVAVDDPACR